jgi:hypothetical protein
MSELNKRNLAFNAKSLVPIRLAPRLSEIKYNQPAPTFSDHVFCLA